MILTFQHRAPEGARFAEDMSLVGFVPAAVPPHVPFTVIGHAVADDGQTMTVTIEIPDDAIPTPDTAHLAVSVSPEEDPRA